MAVMSAKPPAAFGATSLRRSRGNARAHFSDEGFAVNNVDMNGGADNPVPRLQQLAPGESLAAYLQIHVGAVGRI